MGESSAIQAKITSEPTRKIADAFQFFKRQRSEPILPLETLRCNAVSVITARLCGWPRRDEIVGTLGVFRPAVRCLGVATGSLPLDIYIIDAAKVAPPISGFEPSVLRTLLNSAIGELAWVHASDDRRESSVLVLVDGHDYALKGELMRLRAERLPTLPTWVSHLVDEPSSGPVLFEVWWVGPACAARAVGEISRQPGFSVASRHALTASPRRLAVALDLNWLHLAREHLREIASGAVVLPWVAPPAQGLVSVPSGLSRRAGHGG
ncbi:MAG TPA: hypothetical protein VF535_10295 [Allosphingosinicella sp.]|jgi:hypothetical protein